MADLINQIIEIGKNIINIFDANLLVPITELFKSIGTLFVKVLELVMMAIKWVIAKV